MITCQTIVVVLIVVSSFLSSGAQNSTRPVCQSSCGRGKSANKVRYPFGFSQGCNIRLTCDQNGDMKIGEFKILNLTHKSVLVNIPANCSRKISSIRPLFGKSFAPTWENSFLFQNCKNSSNNCVIPMEYFRNGSMFENCNSRSENISCFAERSSEADVLSLESVNKTQCAFLFTSAAFDLVDAEFSLKFQTAELGWWLPVCRCSNNANFLKVKLPVGSGCRCECIEGFDGDGFRDGSGCRKVTKCGDSNYLSGGCGGTTKLRALVGGVIGGASSVTIFALICCFVRRRSTLRSQLSAKRLICDAAGSSIIPLYPYHEIEKATNGFSEKQRLGTGAYGTVYAGKLHNNEWVAIKRIRNRDTDSIDQVTNEIKLLSSVSHQNLVRLLGCCIEKGEQILVYEYMPNGTLSEHLQRERGKGLSWTIRLTVAAETAHAIAYLHSAMNPPIYHRDIKSSNILLDYNYNSKVADFGLSRVGMMENSHISTAPQGTPGYVDPQYHQNFHLSDKSDVYSFGVVLVEIITAMKVVDFSRPHSDVNLAALAVDRIGRGCVDDIIDPFLEPHRDAWTLSSIHRVAELAFRCLAYQQDVRPSMMEVANELEQIRLIGWAPLDENICTASSLASSCSSPYNGSERSLRGMILKKGGIGSQRLAVSQRSVDCLTPMEEVKESSPVSVQDPWLSEQSSPSTNSLLGNVVQ